jgi:hypothetical protein
LFSRWDLVAGIKRKAELQGAVLPDELDADEEWLRGEAERDEIEALATWEPEWQ